MSEPALRTLAPGVHVTERPQGFFGIELGARMTVLELEGGLFVHSPLDIDPATLQGLGDPRWVLAPNLFHHLYAGRWMDAGFEGWAAAGLPDKRSDLNFAGVVEPGSHPFGDELEVLPLQSVPFSNEVVVLHKPSRTLIVTDLLFNIAPDAPWMTRAAMRCMGGYPGCRATVLERVAVKRKIARPEFSTIAGWDFDRVIMAHGEVLESGGVEAFRRAFRWLGL